MNDIAFQIREEAEADWRAVFAIHQAAFGGDGEAKLVNALRLVAVPFISLVALAEGEVVGHICFSPMMLPKTESKLVMGLAPVGVLPLWQRKGVGSALVRTGLDECRKLSVEAVFVLGHAEYYPKFGFVPASRFGIGTEYEVPDDHFMAIELAPEALAGHTGKVKYHPAFSELG